MACARAGTFPAAASRPVWLATITSRVPGTSVATEGRAQAAASSSAMGSPSQREERTKPSAACIQRRTLGSKPRKRMR